MKIQSEITGVILAGGQSRRFGQDKARVVFGPEKKPILLNIFYLLENLRLSPIVISDRDDRYRDLGISCKTDLIANKGPLGGIYTALQTTEREKILVLTCDMPFIGMGMLRKILKLGRISDHGIVYGTDHELQPFPGIYTKKDLSLIKNLLDSEQLEMKNFLMKKPKLRVIPIQLGTSDFFNMNTQEDYKYLKQCFL